METSKNDSLSEIAYNYILKQIISFEYKPRDPIVENDICEILNISRTPLREALRKLEAEGFVMKVRNRGTFVRNYTQEDIVESCDIRNVFELYSLKKCIHSVTPEEIRQVKEELLALTESSSPEEYFQSDENLHNMITRYCMNSRMRSILRSLDVQLEAVRKISAKTPNRLKCSRQEHLQILDAIEKGDLEEASSALSAHLETVKENCVKEYQKMRFDKLGN